MSRLFKNYIDFYDQAGGVTSLFAFGYPITEPYWIRARVGGVEKDVMVQIFERRVLTFTPSNSDQFQVEMGNVGQHYFQWRYPNQGTPWDAPPVYIPVAFGSNRKTQGHLEIYTTDPNGTSQSNITSGGSESRPFSMLRSWDQKEIRIIGTSIVIRTRASCTALRLTAAHKSVSWSRLPTTTIHRYRRMGPRSPSPPIAMETRTYTCWISAVQLYSLTLTTTACINEYATWAPDGGGLVYSSNCTGNFEVFRAELKYSQDKAGDLRKAVLANPINLTNNPARLESVPTRLAGRFQIAFQSNRDGNGELYVTRWRDGSATSRLTFSSGGNEEAPSWSPDGTQIVYDSDVEGDLRSTFEPWIETVRHASSPIMVRTTAGRSTRNSALQSEQQRWYTGAAMAAPVSSLRWLWEDYETCRKRNG